MYVCMCVCVEEINCDRYEGVLINVFFELRMYVCMYVCMYVYTNTGEINCDRYECILIDVFFELLVH
jgi:hypothetical protein